VVYFFYFLFLELGEKYLVGDAAAFLNPAFHPAGTHSPGFKTIIKQDVSFTL